MILDPTEFAVPCEIARHYATFRREAETIGYDDYTLWPLRDGFSGEWLVFPFFLASHPPGLEETFAANQARCPESMAILRSFPNVCSAALSRMEPGCHIHPHTDFEIRNVVRMHLGLIAPEGSVIRVATQKATWHEGEVLLFDGQIEHETANLGDEPRTVMLVDFVLTDDEAARVWGAGGRNAASS